MRSTTSDVPVPSHRPRGSRGSWATRLSRLAFCSILAGSSLTGLVGCQSSGGLAYEQSGLKVQAEKTAPSERMLLIAETYARQGQTDRAETIFARILRGNPSNRRAVAGLHAINPRKTAELADARVLEDVVAFQTGRPLVALNEQARPAAQPRAQLAAAPPVASPKTTPEAPAETASVEALAPVAEGTPVPATLAASPTTERAAAPARRESSAVQPTRSSAVVTAAATSPRRSSVRKAFPIQQVAGSDVETLLTDSDYFTDAGTFADAEADLDLGAALLGEAVAAQPAAKPTPEASPDETPEWAVATADWTTSDVAPPADRDAAQPAVPQADETTELPQVKPFGAVADAEPAAAEAETESATAEAAAQESEASESVYIAAPALDLTPVDGGGWAGRETPRQATAKQFATVPELLDLVVAEKVTTPQLLTAAAALESPDEAVRLAAAEAVLNHRPLDTTAWATVDELIATGSTQTRSLAALMLGTLPQACQRESIPRLLGLLHRDDVEAQSAAALAFGGLGDAARPALGQLRELATDSQSAAGESARISLECLNEG